MTYPTPTTESPTNEQLTKWAQESVCETTDGCLVELDGICEHGHASWFLYLGMI